MLTLLSPAKKLLSIDSPFLGQSSQPQFLDKTAELIEILRTFSAQQIASLMKLSESLATLNYERYQGFHCESCPLEASYLAILLFQGDVYRGLEANTLDDESLLFANSHLGILSGLYGLLKPLDLIQAHRLEMGTKLANSCGKNLYDFWQETITSHINNQLDKQDNPILVNLASNEYFKAIDKKKLNHPVLTLNFKQRINGVDKTIGIHAKRARGLMARFIVDNRIDDSENLKDFNTEGYYYCPETSSAQSINFVREK